MAGVRPSSTNTPARYPAQPEPQRGGVTDLLRGIGNRLRPQLTDTQRTSLRYVHSMLEPNKLGGRDRTFNFGDVDAVVNGLMRDRAGLSARAQGELLDGGRRAAARFVHRGLDDGVRIRGPLARAAADRVYREAPGRIAGELNSGLDGAGVDRATARERDTTPRNLTFAEMDRFRAQLPVLDQLRQQTRERFGMEVQFPNGISQAAISHLLEGRIGVPPGGVMRRVER